MDQPIADLEYEGKKRRGGRCSWIGWTSLAKCFRPVTPWLEGGDGPIRWRSCCGSSMRASFTISDPGMEDLPYEAESVRRFAGLAVGLSARRDHHVISWSALGEGIFEEINAHLSGTAVA